MRASLGIALLLSAGAGCAGRLEASAPVMPVAAAPVALPSSHIDTFVRIPLSAIEAQANAVVPRTFRVDPYTLIVDGTEASPVVTAGYQFERETLGLRVESSRLVLGTTLAYWVRARRHVGPIDIPGSCGVDEPRRHVRLAVGIDARIAEDFSLEPTITLRELTPTDRCEMTFAGVDVTSRIRNAMQAQLERDLPTLRERIRTEADLRGKVSAAFAAMSEPIELDANTYLLLTPEALGVSQPTIEGHYLRVGLSLRARPTVFAGARPTPTVLALPPRDDASGTPSIELHVPLRIGADFIAGALRDEFHLDTGGVRFPATGRRFVRPTRIDVSAYGTQLVVRVEFTGFADGVLYLTGTPTLDTATQRLSAPDLDFTVESRSLLLRLANFLRADDFRGELRERVQLDLREQLETTRLRLTEALRRDLDGIALEGAIDTLRMVDVRSSAEDAGMVATLTATGRVTAHYIGE